MTLQNGVTDDQLGRFYRKTKAISERLGKSLPFDEVMQALQLIHEGKTRVARDMPEDLRHFFQRPIPSVETVQIIGEVGIPEVMEKNAANLFGNKKRFYVRDYVSDLRLSGNQLGQKAGKIATYRVRGMHNAKTLAAEFLNLNEETPASWIKELLISRGHTLTLPVIEMLIETQTIGKDMGLNRCRKIDDPCDRPGNLAFVEVYPGKVELIHFSRKAPKRWYVLGEDFDYKGASSRDQDYLIVRT